MFNVTKNILQSVCSVTRQQRKHFNLLANNNNNNGLNGIPRWLNPLEMFRTMDHHAYGTTTSYTASRNRTSLTVAAASTLWKDPGLVGPLPFRPFGPFSISIRERSVTLHEMHMWGPPKKRKEKKRPLDGKPAMKGVVLKTLVKQPKKPNSGNRKCVLVRLSNGKEKIVYVPGEGHTLQEHNMVLVRVGRLQDVPGVKLKVIRGKYDCGHVVKKVQQPK